MPSLEKQAKQSLEAIRELASTSEGRKRLQSNAYPLFMERDLVILWGLYRGWSMRHMADILQCSLPTIYNRRRIYWQEPHLLFNLPVMHRGLRGKKPLFRCEVCDARLLVSERKARHHVAFHLIPRGHIKAYGLFDPV